MNPNVEDLYRSLIDRLAQTASMDKFFVIGCPKSGTTWMENVLHGHRQIVIKGEGGFAWRLGPLIGQALAQFNAHQREHKIPEVTCFQDQEVALLLRCIFETRFEKYIQESGKTRNEVRVVGDKTPQHTVGLKMLATLFPKAKVIHIIRDPRDAATSAWHHFGKSSGQTLEAFTENFICQIWALQVGSAIRDSQMFGPNYFQVHYEQMLEDAPALARKMFDFLGVDTDDETLQTALEAGSFKKRSGGRAQGEADSNSFFRKGVSGDWTNLLPRDWAAKCCDRIAPLMEKAGYDPSCTEASHA